MLHRRLRTSATGQRDSAARTGAAATEMAILLPFVGFMFVAALDYCRVYHASQTLQNCAQTGALYASGTAKSSASVSAENAAKQAAVADAVSLNPPLQSANVTVAMTALSVTVTVQYEFPLLTLFWGDSGVVVLKRQATMNLAPLPGI